MDKLISCYSLWFYNIFQVWNCLFFVVCARCLCSCCFFCPKWLLGISNCLFLPICQGHLMGTLFVKFFCTFLPIGMELSSVQSHSHIRLFVTPMDCSTPGLSVPHQLPEFTQTHIHWVRDAIQPSHPLSSPFCPTFNLSQHQGLFQWVTSSHQVAKVLEFQLQHHSFLWIFRTDFL